MEARKTREYAALNQETHMHQIVIPRTQRLNSRQCQPLDKDTFATMLIEKLTAVKRSQEQQEFLERKLKEVRNLKRYIFVIVLTSFVFLERTYGTHV